MIGHDRWHSCLEVLGTLSEYGHALGQVLYHTDFPLSVFNVIHGGSVFCRGNVDLVATYQSSVLRFSDAVGERVTRSCAIVRIDVSQSREFSSQP